MACYRNKGRHEDGFRAMATTDEVVMGGQADNPLLQAWLAPHATPPFAEIAPDHFMPAFEQAFADHAAEVDAITRDPAVVDAYLGEAGGVGADA